jgi:hypothetical protein
MCCAAAKRPSTRVKNAVYGHAAIVASVFRVFLLYLVRGVVPDEKVPTHRVVLAAEAMERWNVIIVR